MALLGDARRTKATLIVAGLTMVAAVAVAVVVLTGRDDDTAPHGGKQKGTFRSADGRLEAAVYWFIPRHRFGAVTEVVLRPVGAAAGRGAVSFGCTADEDGLDIVAVTVLPDSIVTRNYNGAERTIRFDPRTLRPEAQLGSC